MLLGTLCASLLGNLLAVKDWIRTHNHLVRERTLAVCSFTN